MGKLLQDVRFALRVFQRAPAFAAAAVLTLAVGIGADTSIFSVANALFLRAAALQASRPPGADRRAPQGLGQRQPGTALRAAL